MEKSVFKQFCDLENRHWWFKGMYALCLDELKRIILSKTNELIILDIGCGTGHFTQSLLKYGKVFALDNTAEALDICRKQCPKYIIQGNAEALPIIDESCDIITALGLIEHLYNDSLFLTEIHRVLKPGGYGLLLTSAYNFLWSKHDNIVHHKRRYTKDSIRKLLKETGLKNIKISYVNTFLFMPILLARIIASKRCIRHRESDGSPDLFMLPQPLNQLLYWILRLESYLLKKFTMPFGVGLFIVVQKPKTHIFP